MDVLPWRHTDVILSAYKYASSQFQPRSPGRSGFREVSVLVMLSRSECSVGRKKEKEEERKEKRREEKRKEKKREEKRRKEERRKEKKREKKRSKEKKREDKRRREISVKGKKIKTKYRHISATSISLATTN